VRIAWNGFSVGAGWAACLLIGLSNAGAVASEWGVESIDDGGDVAAAEFREPVAAESPADSPSQAFGEGLQIPAWVDPQSTAAAGNDNGIELVGFGHHQDACGPECYDCQPSGLFHHGQGRACDRWTATVDAMVLWQNNIASRPLFISTTSLATAMDANQLQTPASVGPRFGLFYHLDNCNSIEGNYFNVQSFTGEYQTPNVSDGYAAVDLASPIPFIVNGAQAISSGEIQSAEVNWRRHAGAITWLAGFRWVEWNSTLGVRSQNLLGEDLVGVNTGNDLYGSQLGADVLLWNGPRGFQVNGLGKAGVYYNTAYQSTSASVSSQPPYAGSARSAADQVAFFGELGINGAWWITDCLAWRLGYSFFWLSGVATPAEQLSLVDISASPTTSGITTDGSVFLQGVTTGLELRW
jgi:hypothetical protein